MDLTDSLAQVQTAISRAAREFGRNPEEIRLLPVSKTQSPATILALANLGIREFGENRVAEAKAKAELISNTSLNWVLIGHLQRNKVATAVKFISELQSLDSVKLAEKLDYSLAKIDKVLPVMVQVHTAVESAKTGIPVAEVINFAKKFHSWPQLKPIGFMTVATNTNDSSEIRRCFGLLRRIQDQVAQEIGEIWPELSMGMTNDYRIAIEMGATCVRMGSAIFGGRGNWSLNS